MKIELVIGNKNLDKIEKKFGMYKLKRSLSCNTAIYSGGSDLTVVDLGSYKFDDIGDGIYKFIYDFTVTMEHETVHKCIYDEKMVNKSFRSWYEKGFILGQANEEVAVCSMSTELSKDNVNYVMLRTLMNKLPYVTNTLKMQMVLIRWYRIMFIFMYFIIMFLVIMIGIRGGFK